MIHFNYVDLKNAFNPRQLMRPVLAGLLSVAICAILRHVKFSTPVLPSSTLSATYSIFTWALTCLLSFRTSVAYNRLWQASSTAHAVTGQFFASCSQLVAFAEVSNADRDKKDDYQGLVVNLFSFLMRSTFCQSSCKKSNTGFNVIDENAFDQQSRVFLESIAEGYSRESAFMKTEIIVMWIYQLSLANMKLGVIDTAPPVVASAFQNLNQGIAQSQQMHMVTDTNFPFLYVQVLAVCLTAHLCITPFMVASEPSPAWSYIMAFVVVLGLQVLDVIAAEIESPFGDDPNDLNTVSFLDEFNTKLRLLLLSGTRRIPFSCLTAHPAIPEELHHLGGFQHRRHSIPQAVRSPLSRHSNRSSETQGLSDMQLPGVPPKA